MYNKWKDLLEHTNKHCNKRWIQNRLLTNSKQDFESDFSRSFPGLKLQSNKTMKILSKDSNKDNKLNISGRISELEDFFDSKI